MEMRKTSYHLSFLVPLQVQLLLVTMVIGLLPMGNGNAYNHSSQVPGCRCSFRLLLCLETLWFLPMEMQTTMPVSCASCRGLW